MAEVTCSRCKRRAPGLDEAPLAGARGERVLAHVCADCWASWVEESKNLINHHGIEVADPQQRRRMYPLMAEYLDLPGLGA
jgi:Fe-S cluster biosynthesis and repair protein YggX